MTTCRYSNSIAIGGSTLAASHLQSQSLEVSLGWSVNENQHELRSVKVILIF